jgi:Domain of unknown function (DUF4387)
MKLIDAVRVIRSKNAGPLTLTIDLLFDDPSYYERALAAESLTPAEIALRYGVPANTVRVTPCPPALAVKIVIDRKIVAGSPGDCDVYGAQQHGPLLEAEI